MMIKLASAFGVAALAFSFTFSNSFACSEAPEITALVSESGGAEGVANGSAPESDFSEGKIAESTSVEASSTDASAPSAIASVDAIAVEITEIVTVVVPGQKSDDSDPTAPALVISRIEPSSDEVATTSAGVFSESDIAEWKLIFDVASAPVAAEIESSSTAAPTIGTVDAIPAELTETIPAVSVEKPASRDVEITGAASEQITAWPH